MFILKLFIAIVFFTAGILRMVYSDDNEIERLNFYPWMPYGEYIIAISEVILALLLFTRFSIISMYLLAFGIIVYTILVLYIKWYDVKHTIKQICTYQGSAKSVVLHITYLVIIISLILDK